METLLQDVKYAARTLAKSPGFTLFAVAVVAIGIAANTGIFRVVDAVLLQALPYSNPDRLVMVWEDAAFMGFPHGTPAPGNYAEWKAQNRVFEDMAGIRYTSLSLTGEGEPEQIQGPAVTANFFSILGVPPQLGRVFNAEEDRPGGAHVAVLSHRLWLRRYGADPQVIGKEVRLNSEKYIVIGVMPRRFAFPDRDAELWVPAAFTSETLGNHDSHYLNVVARLKPGITLRQANEDLGAIARHLAEKYPASNTHLGAFAVPLREELVGGYRRAILVLMGAVAFVLLIACGNVANMVLARSLSRRKELAVRMALGAGRSRIMRLLLTESVLLSSVAGLAGLLLSFWSMAVVAKLIPVGLVTTPGGMNSSVLAFTVAISVAAGALFGVAPALRIARMDLNSSLKQGGGGSGPLSGGARMRSVLVVSEIALSLVLLTGAALMAESFLKLRGVDPGFRAENVLKLRTTRTLAAYPKSSERIAFFDQVLARVEALPGVVSAGYTSLLPLTTRGGTQGITIEGRPAPLPGEVNDANARVVSPDYMKTLGVPLIAGRYIDRHDRETSLPVATINQTMARRFWPRETALGKRFKVGEYGEAVPWITVVGVVGDVHQMGLEVPARAEMYFPYPQRMDFFSPRDLAIKTAGDPWQVAAAVRQQIWAVDKDQPISAMMPLQDLLDEEVAPRKLQASLLSAFAALALLLASLGTYAVVSYSVTQRTQELGVRMALGAQRRNILGMVLASGLRLAVIGVVVGVAGAAALSRVLAGILYGVTATDPRMFALAACLLVGVALVASFVPARRAMRVDPIVALRNE
ncbi:MAG: ABC transporter permease [Acidipila sp.]|nr:ABC transporter permease [Acidipila sp.]